MCRKEASLCYKTISSVRLCWELDGLTPTILSMIWTSKKSRWVDTENPVYQIEIDEINKDLIDLMSSNACDGALMRVDGI